MAMDPIRTRDGIRDDYLAYLQSILTVQSAEITRKARLLLDGAGFVKGPYLEATPPFEAGKSLEQLCEEGVISKEVDGIAEGIHLHRPLYVHQEAAIRAIVARKNIIVATGTGSGKTECYLYPILNSLMRESEQNTLAPGVRALLLFPMNALANDQLKKLRQLLRGMPLITFGRFTGETPDGTEESARADYRAKYGHEALRNEMLSRKRIRETPPHILLTNYAMLEYLLLRPEDSELFDGASARSWRFLVLDEAHTYKGTNGSEIAMLLRRLKERISRTGTCRLQCIATSATLGDPEAGPALADFAESIFGEPFLRDSIITARRLQPREVLGMRDFAPQEYTALQENANRLCEDGRSAYIYGNLKNDRRIVALHDILQNGPMAFDAAANQVFSDIRDEAERNKALVLLVSLASQARKDEGSAGLLSARYHLFVKSLEGMFVSLYPGVQVYLDRREVIQEKGLDIAAFELANCENCSREYLIGKIENGYLRQKSTMDRPEFFLIGDGSDSPGFDTDEDEGDEHAFSGKMEKMVLCAVCGRIRPSFETGADCCSCADPGKYKTVFRVAYDRENETSNICPCCGANRRGILKRFLTSNHAATFAVAESLYAAIPPRPTTQSQPGQDDFWEDIPFLNPEYDQEKGRKLLIFSDNRQEAAFFAGYLDNRHRRVLWRRMLLKILRRNGCPMSLADLADELVREANRAGVTLEAGESESSQAIRSAHRIIMREFLALDRSTGLEGLGYLEFFPEPRPLSRGKWGLEPDDAWSLIRLFLDTLRQSGAVSFPERIAATDDFFAPQNHTKRFRESGSYNYRGTTVLSLIPSPGRGNKRSLFIQKLLEAQGRSSKETVDDTLREVCGVVMSLGDKGRDYLRRDSVNNALCFVLNSAKWRVRALDTDAPTFRCSRCGRLFSYSVGGLCPEYHCDGRLTPRTAEQARNDPYDSRLYDDPRLLPMECREHTAQLSKDAAGDYQRDFEEGRINVLSCSTTFEMGVDVGELEATFLRNVPPETANYIQRAGRAGRRTASTAFAVTFIRRNSHDLTFFQQPEKIISGKIRPPYIEMNNEKVVRRHIHSVVMSWFFRKHPDSFRGGAGAFCGYDAEKSALELLKGDLQSRPEALEEAVSAVTPRALWHRLGVETWHFADELVGEGGVLERALSQRAEELREMQTLKNQRDSENRPSEGLRKQINTLKMEDVLGFLSSCGVLPKYGFPIDVVKMTVLGNSNEASRIDLSRDLKLAVGEYAPPSRVVANGKVWTSYALRCVPNRGWPEQFYYRCTEGHFAFPDGVVIDEAQLPEKVCFCGNDMKHYRYIEPIFGFSTSIEDEGHIVGDDKPQHAYTTRVQFRGIGELDSFQEQERKRDTFRFHGRTVETEYSPNGRMVVLNCGKGGGLWICNRCGYVSALPETSKHRTRLGDVCSNTHLSCRALGHSFGTDILRIQMPGHHIESPKDQELSVLYAILEGAAEALDISRNDIDGCVDAMDSCLILYDVAAGGAGHVRRIALEFEKVLQSACARVDGRCGCSEETSCYGCLRNYGNQMDHDKLCRGLAYQYLKWLVENKKC